MMKSFLALAVLLAASTTNAVELELLSELEKTKGINCKKVCNPHRVHEEKGFNEQMCHDYCDEEDLPGNCYDLEKHACKKRRWC